MMVKALELDGDESGHGHTQSMVIEGSGAEDITVERFTFKAVSITPDRLISSQQIKAPLISESDDRAPDSCSPSDDGCPHCQAKDKEIQQIKEKFSKLLLGEDMSGGGKGVTSALALSNAVTNLAASVFADQKRLEPLHPEQKARWKKEIEWLLSITDYIVEFSPSQQKGKDGTHMEIMTTKQRTDLKWNIPALRKLDHILIDCLDNFKDQNEFYYVSKDSDESENGAEGKEEKWWLPNVKVPPDGLSEVTRQWIQAQKDSVNHVLKAAMAINAQVLAEMEIPESYMESLPKNGRSSLGDSLYKSITVDHFDAEQFLSAMDLSSEHKIVDLKNRIEASNVIWRRKMTKSDSKSPWGSSVSLEKRELFEERAATVLIILKHRYPGISQSALDISKIQFNKNVGQALLESYSRVLESLAHRVLTQIDDVLHADSLAQNPSLEPLERGPLQVTAPTRFSDIGEEIEKLHAGDAPCSMTLIEFIEWSENEMRKNSDENGEVDSMSLMVKLNADPTKKFSHTEKLQSSGGSWSPTSRH